MRHFAIPKADSSAAETELAAVLGRTQPACLGADHIVAAAVSALDRNGNLLVIPIPACGWPYEWRL